MTDPADPQNPTTPAGWYADPERAGHQRYWDGQRWTDYRHDPAAPQSVVYVQQSSKTNGMAIASMVLGILWIYWVGSILALVFGYIAKSQIDKSNGRESGRGMAIAGIVLGWIGVAVLVILIILALAGVFDDWNWEDWE
jgi:hypothetical protein